MVYMVISKPIISKRNFFGKRSKIYTKNLKKKYFKRVSFSRNDQMHNYFILTQENPILVTDCAVLYFKTRAVQKVQRKTLKVQTSLRHTQPQRDDCATSPNLYMHRSALHTHKRIMCMFPLNSFIVAMIHSFIFHKHSAA